MGMEVEQSDLLEKQQSLDKQISVANECIPLVA
jgi:hypothetical protein